MSKRAILYARVSGDDTGKDGRNLDGQIAMCREFATNSGWQIVDELSEDIRGVSGANRDAPELNRALDMAQAGLFDILVVREMDRLARSLVKQIVTEDQFKRAGVKVAYVLENYEDTPEGQFGKNIRATLAELERAKTRERTVRGRRRTVKDGSVMLHGAGAPYGYRKGKDGRRVILIIDEGEARIVTLIFDWYTIDGLTIREIARRLTEMGIPTPADKDGKNMPKKRSAGGWGPSGVANIINREAYAGTWLYGKYNNFTNTTNPPEHLIPVTVPAIISRETWEIAQARKEQNKALSAGNTRHNYLMRALVRCGRCGASVGTQATPHRNGSHYLYYRCNAAKKSGSYVHTCDMVQFRADKVDGVVWEWVRAFISNPQEIREGAELYRQNRAEFTRPIKDKLTVTERLLKESTGQLEKLLDVYLTSDMAKEMLMERKERLEGRITALETERAELTQKLEAMSLTDDQIITLENFASRVGRNLEKADSNFLAQRQIIETLGLRGKITIVDGEQFIDITCHFAPEVSLNVSQISSNRVLRISFCRRR